MMGRPMLDYLSMYEVDDNGCWLYTHTIDKKGYGACGAQGSAHRFFYKKLVGPIPEGLQIDHLCRVTRCVNVEHMEPVTVQENLRRKYAVYVYSTHCSRGHERTAHNTYHHPAGYQECTICRKINKRNFRVRHGAK